MRVKFRCEHYLNKVLSFLVSHFCILLCSIPCLQGPSELSHVGNDIYEHLVQPWCKFIANFSHEVCEGRDVTKREPDTLHWDQWICRHAVVERYQNWVDILLTQWPFILDVETDKTPQQSRLWVWLNALWSVILLSLRDQVVLQSFTPLPAQNDMKSALLSRKGKVIKNHILYIISVLWVNLALIWVSAFFQQHFAIKSIS